MPLIANESYKARLDLSDATTKKHVKMHLKRASFLKFGLISEFFSLSLKYPKKGAKNYIDYYPPKEKMLRIVI